MTPAHSLLVGIAEKITLPVVYHRIKSLILTSDATIDQYVDVVVTDPALSARIVRIANSAFFGYVRKANNVKQAISLIGVIQLHDLLLSSLAIRAFSSIPSDVLNQDAYWRSSVYCGIVARLLAKQCLLPASERLFTLGLLHEIGHIVMYTRIPEQIQEVLVLAQQSEKPLYLLEREILGFDYCQVGRELMSLWHLPGNYQDIVANHNEPTLAKKYKDEKAIVNLARWLMLEDENEFQKPLDPELCQGWQMLQLSQEQIVTIQNNARLFVDDVMDCLWPFTRNKTQECLILF